MILNLLTMKRILLFLASLFCVYTFEAQTTLHEDFESWPLTGWQILERGAALDGWIEDWEGIQHTGTGSANSGIDNAQSDNWLISPAVNVVNGNYQLKYWEISKNIGYYYKATVLVSSGSNDPASGDFVEIYEANMLNDALWEERIIDLSAYNGQNIYVAFRHEGGSQGTYHNWFIDDVSVSPSSYTDGTLTQFLSPNGVSETPVTASVTVKIKNLGTTIINDFDITWEVNSIAQPTYNQVGLNLQPGQSLNINIGTYNFDSEGAYTINTTLNLLNDFDSSNNQIQNTFEISSFKDGAIVNLTPQGMLPNAANIDVKATVTNLGVNTIDIAEVLWSVNGVDQTPYATTSLNLLSGETRTITLGQYVFTSGLKDIKATLHALGDINDSNNQYKVTAAIATFWESFEGNVFPPEGWSFNFGTRDGINFDNPVDGNYYYVSSTDDNYFGVITDTIYTPLLNIKSGDHFKFYIKTAPPTPQNHSLVWKNGTTGVVTFIQSIANSPGMSTWALRDINISAAAGTNYIGIVSTSSNYGESKFDLFTSDAKLHVFNNDLKILNGDIPIMAKQNVSERFECTIKNSGALPVLGANYTLKLMEAPNTELASINGVDLNSWEETIIAINHTFTAIDVNRLFFKIAYSADENLSNNTFREANISVVPNTVEISAIGSPDTGNLNMPFTPNGNTNTLAEDDMSEMLFYNNEFNSPGYVHGFVYKYDNISASGDVKHYPLKVWIAQTPNTNLDGGWTPNNQLTLVYDGVVEILPGYNRDLYIPFNQPVLINGIENVVIKCYQYDPEWPPSLFRIFSTNLGTGPTRSISIMDYYNLDPNDPATTFNTFSDFSYTRFVVNPVSTKTVLSGVVYNNASNTPMENATVAVEGSAFSVQTDSNGNYVLPELPQGTYNIKISATGFQEQSIEVDLNTPSQTQDFYLDPLLEIQVTGTVFGNNNESVPLELVNVSLLLNGNVFDSVTTNANGEFIFPLVYGGFDYKLKVFMYGYDEKIIPISAVATNIDLGDIILDVEFISPFDVTVDTNSEPTVNWKSPKLSKKVKLKKDFNVRSYSLTNEPNENVWLGNFFAISQITTLTSVEIQTDFYTNATDYVTIDIFDLATEQILATSKPFLIYPDSLQTIDIPNIVVTKTILAMVHWQNNTASTNALAIDYSDPYISNSAMVKYPGASPQLLSNYLSNAPKMSFILRVNTLDDGNPVTNTETVSYNVYRGLASDFPNVSNWELINLTPVSDVSLIDMNTSGIDPNEYYRYAVETIYSNGFSEVTYSNSISGSVLGTLDYQLLNSQILVYPVPTNNKITIKLGPNIQVRNPIKVFDTLGKQVLVIQPSDIQNGYVTKSVTSLQSGIYFIRIDIDNVIINKKFIVN